MKNLFDREAYAEVEQRIMNLAPETQHFWGKMDAAQMLAHCSAAIEVPVGLKFPPQLLMGKILGPIFKRVFVGEAPFRKNGPTDPSFVVADKRDFMREQERLLSLVRRFYEGGPEKCSGHPHSFFGRLTPQEWSVVMYKHLDHHLRQFGA